MGTSEVETPKGKFRARFTVFTPGGRWRETGIVIGYQTFHGGSSYGSGFLIDKKSKRILDKPEEKPFPKKFSS